ncbi:hypothetical protein EDB89DRAFT_1910829 [Lactarius sanguifluus]|nr:hypothetical protein EDB89DRAFT_1910829 [Lactarius sanguifluus]
MRATRQLSAIRSPASNVIWFSALGPAIKRLWLKSASVIFGYSQPRVYVIRFSAHPAPRQGIIRYQRGVACHVGVVWGSVVAGALRVMLKGRGGSWGVVCRVGVARWVGGVLGQGRMEVERPATSRDGRGAWKGESGEARRGVEVGAQAGGLRPPPQLRKMEDVAEDEPGFGPMHKAIATPLCTRTTSIRPHPNTPLRHGSQHATTANPLGHPNTARKTFSPINKISHSTSIRPCPNTPPTHRATPTRHATPHDPPCPFNATRNAPATTNPHTTPTWRATPRHLPTHHHANTPPPLTRHAPSTQHATPQQPPTPTPPQHSAQHPATRRLTATPTPRHRRPATSPQRGAQHPADPSRCRNMATPAMS